jgi:hypothetical protein
MQLTNALCVLILAVTVSSAAVPNAQPIAAAIAEPKCWERGQPCGKAKREANPEAKCWERGQPCGKVKRAAEAFAHALAEPTAEPQEDSLFARHARHLTRDLASIVAETQDDPEAYFTTLGLPEDSTIDKRDALALCWERGQPCGKAKREASPEAKCWERGQPCGKLRRAAEALAEAVAVAEPEAKCWERGQPCGKAKRNALAMAHAADIVLAAL